MTHVQPKDIRALGNQLAQRLGLLRCRSERANDFRFPHGSANSVPPEEKKAARHHQRAAL
jgi:hypothetical protein